MYLMDFLHPMMTCMICWQTFDCSSRAGPRLDTIKKHHKRRHNDLKGYDDARKRLLIRKNTREKEESQKDMEKLTTPDWLTKVAPFKLAFIIGQYKTQYLTAKCL